MSQGSTPRKIARGMARRPVAALREGASRYPGSHMQDTCQPVSLLLIISLKCEEVRSTSSLPAARMWLLMLRTAHCLIAFPPVPVPRSGTAKHPKWFGVQVHLAYGSDWPCMLPEKLERHQTLYPCQETVQWTVLLCLFTRDPLALAPPLYFCVPKPPDSTT
ncbi:hypothetical protein SISNIDRAFT_313106 [Sistotremastrum niveocremeum HHB9708]|uniref:Uncharacterized protein n=2 Tax=Sistotremastraceae TaxID=3402574 RepID=A0A164XXL6_9AGAM|nr:hypothetical protein SISNIDRAFT_313106 [Sistotremastrum niveocremeum HHB9708]KZT35341.1 hypothetical protein SISSUDRAFT_184424 [Sistotremastrum suecicum HHB10207 ss-3]